MRVINIHKRAIDQPKEKVSQLFKTLATTEDKIWPHENWPAIRFKEGVKIGSKGGHGPIRYTIVDFAEGDFIKFKFSKPEGFNGTHKLKINAVNDHTAEIIHEIRARTSFKATVLWVFVIRLLHDALIEDAFDKVENYFLIDKKKTNYNGWVKLLRSINKRKSIQSKHA